MRPGRPTETVPPQHPAPHPAAATPATHITGSDGWLTHRQCHSVDCGAQSPCPPQTSDSAKAVVEPHGRELTSSTASPRPDAGLLLRTVDELTERTLRADDALPERSSARDRVRTSTLTYLDFIPERSPGWMTYQALAEHDPGDETARVRRQAREAAVAAGATASTSPRGATSASSTTPACAGCEPAIPTTSATA